MVFDFRCLQIHQAVQRMFVGVPSWNAANRSSSAWSPRQPRNVPPICCPFYRSRRLSTRSILWLAASSTSQSVRSQDSRHRLPLLPIPSCTCRFAPTLPFGMGAVLLQRGQPKAWMAIEWNKRDRKLLAAVSEDPLGRPSGNHSPFRLL